MSIIRKQDFIDSIADALQYISFYHPLDFVQAAKAAYDREINPAAKDALAQILINSRMSAEGHRPLCQDTGTLTFFWRVRSVPPRPQQRLLEQLRRLGWRGIHGVKSELEGPT